LFTTLGITSYKQVIATVSVWVLRVVVCILDYQLLVCLLGFSAVVFYAVCLLQVMEGAAFQMGKA
jgi:hypothetical protein